ncbi:MAG: MlaD family protein [Pseudomonadota bacterium]
MTDDKQPNGPLDPNDPQQRRAAERPPAARMAVRQRRKAPSIVWALPVLAVLIGLWLVAQNVWERGPRVTLRFKAAEGVEAGKTKIRYKDVDIGTVRAVRLSTDRKEVLVHAELIKDAEDMLVSDSKFYVVRPRISAGAVSGLGTLLSGVYIGIDIGASPEEARDFVGLETPPVVLADSAGREFVLQGDEIGSLEFGSPVFFRNVKVGHVTQYTLNPDGKGVTVRLFVDAPHERYVTNHTRFWHASGIDMSFDSSGFKLSTESLASVIEGGLAFQERPDALTPGEPAAAGATFTLFTDRDRAMRPTDGEVRTYLMYFAESLRGLAPGAPVDMRGIVMGEVKSLGVEYGATGQVLRFPVEINIYPDRLRSRVRTGTAPPADNGARERELVDRLFAAGLRGQLRNGNLLTGQLYVALDFFPDAPKVAMDWNADPPVMPTINGGLVEMQETVGRIAKRLDRVPIDQLSRDLAKAVTQLNATLASSDRLMQKLDTEVAPEVSATLREARSTLEAGTSVLANDAPLQQDLRETLKQINRSARSLAALTELLERHPESLLFGKKKPEDGR